MKSWIIIVLIFATFTPGYAEEWTIQFSKTEWRQVLAKVERDQLENKLLRSQNKDLKQLVTVRADQYEACEKLVQSGKEFEQVDDEYRRQLESQNESLKSSIRTNHWIMGGEAAAILVLLFFVVR